jgi:hypothetical protein
MIDIVKYEFYFDALRSKFQDFLCSLDDSGEDIVSKTIVENPIYPDSQAAEIFATLPQKM